MLKKSPSYIAIRKYVIFTRAMKRLTTAVDGLINVMLFTKYFQRRKAPFWRDAGSQSA